MNIKGAFPIIGPSPVRVVDKLKGAIKSDESHDRDANGQQAFQQNQQQPQREPMSEEMFQDCVEQLRSLPPVKEHHWIIETTVIDGKRFVLVKDNLANIIRKIPEADLWSLSLDKEAHSGNLIKRTA